MTPGAIDSFRVQAARAQIQQEPSAFVWNIEPYIFTGERLALGTRFVGSIF